MFFLKAIVFSVCLSLMPVLGLKLWVATESRRLQVSSHALERLRRARFFAWIGQLGALMVNSGLYSFIGQRLHATWFVYLALIPFTVGIFVQSQISFKLERVLRSLQAERKQYAGLSLRKFGTFFLIYCVYFISLLATTSVLGTLIWKLTAPGLARDILVSVLTPTGVFCGLAAIYLLSPHFVRLLFPSRKLREGERLAQLQNWFRESGLEPPEVFLIELDDFRMHNAMVAGIYTRFKIFNPRLFITRSLLEDLPPEELRAVILHEASHLALKHMQKRFVFAFVLVMLSMFPVMGFLGVSSAVLGPLHEHVAVGGSILVAIVFQMLLFRRQVRRHEYEADAWAVFELDADIDAFASVLKRIHCMNDQNPNKKDLMSLLNPAAAHPTCEQRIAALRMRMEAEDVPHVKREDAA